MYYNLVTDKWSAHIYLYALMIRSVDSGLTPIRSLQKGSLFVVSAIVQAEENRESLLVSHRRFQELSALVIAMFSCQIRKIGI